MTSRCILGIDPGISGAVAFYFPAVPDKISVDDMPTAAGEVDPATLVQRIGHMRPDLAIIERVHSMPRQGVASTFKFGSSFGIAIGVVAALGISTHFVSPGRWKRHYTIGRDKEMARALALRLWPTSIHFSRKRDHNRAEAALLARYGAEVLAGAPEC
jgi:crossover junction endodeoxyribonuclease RuvC